MARVEFLIGASGAGKTAVALEIERRGNWSGAVHYFDRVGVPSAEEMERDYGGGEGWQRWATKRWVAELAGNDRQLQLLEGQTRPSFILEAAAAHPALEPLIVLLDCTPEVRGQRLDGRGQPELANHQMNTWAAYLRGQADALGLPVIDTGDLSVHEVADRVEELARQS